jgi:predicted Rossmann fold flavoprotein
MNKLGVTIRTSTKAENIETCDNKIIGVRTFSDTLLSPNVIIATGGLGYPVLGAEGDGYEMAKSCGHKVTDIHPAMMPLHTKEQWVANCIADTIPKVDVKIDLKKAKNIKYKGDLIFTRHGIRGPVVLDIAREITPFLDIYGEVPILANLTKGLNEEQIRTHVSQNSSKSIMETISEILPLSVATQLIALADIDTSISWAKTAGIKKDKLIKLLAWTPLTITGHDGFKLAMITRGGVSLKEIEPRTMGSKIIKGLYFCGEVMDLDGPCGGYNLQWSFASGHLAGMLL